MLFVLSCVSAILSSNLSALSLKLFVVFEDKKILSKAATICLGQSAIVSSCPFIENFYFVSLLGCLVSDLSIVRVVSRPWGLPYLVL